MPAQVADPSRNYPALFRALDEALEALADGLSGEDALKRSFEGSADGFGAQKALVLIVEAEGPRLLRAVASRGLTPTEVTACEEGQSVPGVSSSRIREALVGRTPVLVRAKGDLATQVLVSIPSIQSISASRDPRPLRRSGPGSRALP